MELKNRSQYLDKLISVQDMEVIKVVTGIRRCGKSSLLKLMMAHLREQGGMEEQILSTNFESMQFADMDSKTCFCSLTDLTLQSARPRNFRKPFRLASMELIDRTAYPLSSRCFLNSITLLFVTFLFPRNAEKARTSRMYFSTVAALFSSRIKYRQ